MVLARRIGKYPFRALEEIDLKLVYRIPATIEIAVKK